MDKESLRAALRGSAEYLRRHDIVRAALVADRDSLILRARDAGVTWVDIQADTGLTPGAVRAALARAQN